MEMDDDLALSESAERLRRAKERIQERNSVGRNVVEPIRNRRNPPSDRADEPGGEPSAGGKKISPARKRPTEGVSGYNPTASRPDRGTLADGGTDSIRSVSNRGRTQRVTSQQPSLGGEVARQKNAYTEAAEEWMRRVLAYAGFDVRGDARSLTSDEVDKLQPNVAVFMQRIGMVLDWVLTHANRAQEESDIWMLSDEEANTLAHIYLKRARKIGWMAEVARQVHHIEDLGDAKRFAEIVGKRAAASGVFVVSNGGLHPWMSKK